MDRIILASVSPRRQEILTQAGIRFETVPSNVDENLCDKASPYELTKELSHRKAWHVAQTAQAPAVIIAADTVVTINGEIIGKPSDESDAFIILKKLLGKKHSVYTGVTLIKKTESELLTRSFVDNAEVYMRAARDCDIESYIKTGEPMDKAGAYAIQGRGCVFVEKIEGDFYTVMGLPISRVYLELEAMGVELYSRN